MLKAEAANLLEGSVSKPKGIVVVWQGFLLKLGHHHFGVHAEILTETRQEEKYFRFDFSSWSEAQTT